MVSRETTQLLRWHAGLEGDALDVRSVSGSLAAGGDVEHAMSDFIEAMARLNQEMNGAQPSAAVDGKEDYISRDVAYAVAEVTRMLRDAARVIEAWAVDTAWNAVLAGDIDDMAEHLEAEKRARPPRSNEASARRP